ncbi:MAG: hypothetical protein BWK76_18295 [Desulfobulbaceae bacterium A2]|nr:MAG: hypothetical protein BWK76_18295 [Desulfobulbaceae bacterium A2]
MVHVSLGLDTNELPKNINIAPNEWTLSKPDVKPSGFLADIAGVGYLYRRFLRRYIPAIISLVLLNAVTGLLVAAVPLSVAPAASVVLNEHPDPASSLAGITLDNLGPSIMSWLRLDPHNVFAVMLTVAVLYVSLTVLAATLKTVAFILSVRVSCGTLHDMITALHRHVVSLPLSFFNAKREGDVISRFTSDTTATVNLLDGLIRGLFQALIQAFFLFFVLFRTDPLLSLATITIGGMHFLITRSMGGWVRRRTKAVYDFYGRMTAALQESLQNIRITKCLAAEQFDYARLDSEAGKVRDSLYSFRIARYAEEPVRLVADALSVCAMLFLAYYAMTSGRLTRSGFGMFVFLAARVVGPISDASKHLLSVFAVAGSSERLLEIFSLRTSMPEGVKHAPQFRSDIRFEDVSFSHENGTMILNSINLQIRRGEMVAIVGPSGGGKSTLCDLLLRLHDPVRGRVSFDGEDIRNFNKATYLRHFGVVPQESLLLNASVIDNVLYGRTADQESFEEAIRVANATAFIDAMPERENTMIGDRGVRLSGGQRQRLAIARAVYGHPEILVLDEATSALDAESELVVQRAIDNAIRSITAVVVAHRLSTIIQSDKIVVMDNGRIDGIGTHQELLATNTIYKRLYSLHIRESSNSHA